MTTLSDRIEDYCFIDTETKALPHTRGTPDESVVDCGAYRYRRGARVVMIQHAIGAGPVHVAAFPDFDLSRQFIWSKGRMSEELWEFHQRVLAGEAWYAAWNMTFDRLMLNTIEGCVILPEHTIDVMAQAMASNMPPKLEGASKFIGRSGKQHDGKDLIKLFSNADGWHQGEPPNHTWAGEPGATPWLNHTDWSNFKSYGAQDIDELRAVFQASRPLPRSEWREYWTSERINDRGMMVDVDFAYRCDLIHQANKRRLGAQLRELTGGAVTQPTQRERIANWLYDHAGSELLEARNALVKTWEEDEDAPHVEDEDVALVPGKLSIAEDRLKRFIAFFEDLDEREGLTDHEWELLQIALARSFGASATPAKFGKIIDMHDDGILCGQYRFNGAQQTGRFSSVAVQIHNLIRASLTDKEHRERELDVIEFINQLALD